MPDNLPQLVLVYGFLILAFAVPAWRSYRRRRVAWGPGIRQHLVVRAGWELKGPPELPDFRVLVEPTVMGRHSRRPPPYGHIAPGERVWLMVDGVIVATAVVAKYAEVEDRSLGELRELTVGYGVHDDDGFWRRVKEDGFLGRVGGVVIWTADPEPLQFPYRSRAPWLTESWVVVDLPELAAKWLPPGAAKRAAA